MDFKTQIAEFARIDSERAQKRLERLEAEALNEEIRLAKAGAGEAVALTCQSGIISRFYRVKNQSYYNKTAVALQTNIERWICQIGERYANKVILSGCQNRLEYLERVARDHVAEFTITIPHEAGEDLKTARRRFCRAFDNFNKRFLKEKARDCFGDFVRVFEPHKNGVLHAHILIECRKSLRRGSMAFQWRKFAGADFVKGESVADWVRDVWQQFRAGDLCRYGIGKIHTLQPIRKGVKCFSKYISKYITKSLGARPEYMRGLRAVAYSAGFLAGSRLKVFETDKAERITYFSKVKNKWLTRYKRFPAFSINCASNRARGRKLLNVVKFLGVPLETIKGALGSGWYWQLRNAVHNWRLTRRQWRNFGKWERFASVRNALGDKFKCLIKFENNPEIFRYEDFLKISSEYKAQHNFAVIGFIDNGAFVPVKKAMQTGFDFALKSLWKLRDVLRNRIEHIYKLENVYQKRADAYDKREAGKLTRGQWHLFLERWRADYEVITSGVKRWLKPYPRKIENANENKIEFKQLNLGV